MVNYTESLCIENVCIFGVRTYGIVMELILLR